MSHDDTVKLAGLLRSYAERTTGYIFADEVAVLNAAADALLAADARLRALEQVAEQARAVCVGDNKWRVAYLGDLRAALAALERAGRDTGDAADGWPLPYSFGFTYDRGEVDPRFGVCGCGAAMDQHGCPHGH